MADLEVGLSHSEVLATTNGRALDDSAREDQVLIVLPMRPPLGNTQA